MNPNPPLNSSQAAAGNGTGVVNWMPSNSVNGAVELVANVADIATLGSVPVEADDHVQ